MAISDYLENKLIDGTLRGTTYTAPATVYVALYKSDPTDADAGSEVAGGSYVRKAATFSAPSNGSTSNTADILFTQATADWGEITHVGVRDAATTGNLLYHGPLDQAKTIYSGDQFKIPAGQLKVTLT
jgi:hypothetical protein